MNSPATFRGIIRNLSPRAKAWVRERIQDSDSDSVKQYRYLCQASATHYRRAVILGQEPDPIEAELTYDWLSFMADRLSYHQTGTQWSGKDEDIDKHFLLVDVLRDFLVQSRKTRRTEVKTSQGYKKTATWAELPLIIKDGHITNEDEALHPVSILGNKWMFIKAAIVAYIEMKYDGWDVYQDEHLYLFGRNKGKLMPMAERYPKLYQFLLRSVMRRYVWMRASYHYSDGDFNKALELYTAYRTKHMLKKHDVAKDLTQEEVEWFRDKFITYSTLLAKKQSKSMSNMYIDTVASLVSDNHRIAQAGRYKHGIS